jgi:Zn-dependent M28 family amino/carboxypeptidase
LANRQTGDWIRQELEAQGWAVEMHEFVWNETPVRNLIARVGEEGETQGGGGAILLGAHYDTRLVADQDPDPNRRGEPVIGGNDGASGVAVLLELARVLDKQKLTSPLWLAFFDAEDNGRLPGWELWGIGSTRLAEDWAAAGTLPAAMILVDMIGDEDQRIPMEANSDLVLSQAIFDLAAEMGYEEWFPATPGPAIIDDHIAFVQRGVPSVDLIDFDYPYYHTTADTCDKLSAASLERVGRLLLRLVEEGRVQAALQRREQASNE